MGKIKLVRGGTFAKRLRQLGYLCRHPLNHYRCASMIRRTRMVRGPVTALKYLGDHLSLSMGATERRDALMGHYAVLPALLRPLVRRNLAKGIQLWQRALPGDLPPLSVKLEPSRLAPMEGELQLTFSFRTHLFVLTFLLAPGHAFGVEAETVVFIGGMQGRMGSREEIREASKLNGEISPAATLILALQAFAAAAGIDDIIAIDDDDQVSSAYSPLLILFDYRRFWADIGGKRRGRYYRIPIESPSRPLSDIPITHRRRTRRKREAKRLLRQAFEQRFGELLVRESAMTRPSAGRVQVRPIPVPAFS